MTCEHKSAIILQEVGWSRATFTLFKCTWDCKRVLVDVNDRQRPFRLLAILSTHIAPYNTVRPEEGNCYYWEWDGLQHQSRIIPGLEMPPKEAK